MEGLSGSTGQSPSFLVTRGLWVKLTSPPQAGGTGEHVGNTLPEPVAGAGVGAILGPGAWRLGKGWL